ncbi:MAG: hypothetical protein OEQ47_04695 [Acidimicrobiia bacterium]|nr:hypothetical protein [Acidimicrobiia bacterium]
MRIGIGVVAVAALAAAAVLGLGGDDTNAGISARIGLVLVALWIAFPVLSEVDRRTYLFIGLGALVVLWRPRSALVVLPALALAIRRRD